jgi:hypothetical protein
MDQDDPEKRIAELERQLAEAQAAARRNEGPPVISASAGPNPPPPPGFPPPTGFPPPPAAFPPPGAYPAPPANWPSALPLGKRRKRRKWLSVPLFVLVVLFVLGKPIVLPAVQRLVQQSVDHEGPFATADPSVPKACDVLTQDMARSVAGTNAAVSESTVLSPHETLCRYTGANGSVRAQVGSWSLIKPSYPDQQSVPDIGDEAFIAAETLFVRKGDLGFELLVDVSGNTSEARHAAERTIGAQMVSKLP